MLDKTTMRAELCIALRVMCCHNDWHGMVLVFNIRHELCVETILLAGVVKIYLEVRHSNQCAEDGVVIRCARSSSSGSGNHVIVGTKTAELVVIATKSLAVLPEGP